MLELNKTHLGDNTELIKELPNNCVDLTVTSPPYDDLRTYTGKVDKATRYPGGYSFPFEALAQELYRVTKPGGVVVWVIGDGTTKEGSETGTSFRQALYFMKCGFLLYDTMIYQKAGPAHPDKVRYQQVFEYMFVFSKGRPKTINLIADRKNNWAGHTNFGRNSNRNPDGSMSVAKKPVLIKEFGIRFNVWVINAGYGYSTKDTISHEHPATYPEEIPDVHIKTWTEPGDLVLDPFMGSGTTAKMALLNSRKYLGFEMVPEYVTIIEKRLKDLQGETKDGVPRVGLTGFME